MTFLDIKLVGCQRTPAAPRCGDRRHFVTICGQLGWHRGDVPPHIASYIRWEISRARKAARAPSIARVRRKIAAGPWNRAALEKRA